MNTRSANKNSNCGLSTLKVQLWHSSLSSRSLPPPPPQLSYVYVPCKLQSPPSWMGNYVKCICHFHVQLIINFISIACRLFMLCQRECLAKRKMFAKRMCKKLLSAALRVRRRNWWQQSQVTRRSRKRSLGI